MFCSNTQGISSDNAIPSSEVDSENRVSEPQVSSFQDSQLEPLSPQTLLTEQPLTSAQCASLCPLSCDSCDLHQHAFRDQSLLDRKDAQLWRRDPQKLDCPSDQGQTFRVEGGAWRATETRAEGQDDRPQQSGQEEGRSSRVCLQAWSECQQQHDDCSDLCPGRAQDHSGSGPNRNRQDELRPVSRPHIRGSDDSTPLLRHVGSEDGGRRGCLLASGPVDSMGEPGGSEAEVPSTNDKVQDEHDSSTWLHHGSWEPLQGPSRRFVRHLVQSCRTRSTARDRGPQVGASSRQTGEVGAREHSGPHQTSPRDVSESGSEDAALNAFPEQQCCDKHKILGRNWKEHNNPFSSSWQNLIHSGRIFLLEVACSETSVLSQEAFKQLGSDAAQRCSIWNGYDLTSSEGRSKLKKLISQTRPVHVWISCDCGPYSPLQRLNQKSIEQQKALEEKRSYALQEYLGGIEIAEYAMNRGSFVHWELSERCEAWKLPAISEFVDRHQFRKVTCHGCTVGLKASDTGELMCKGWTIASRHEGLLQHMNLPCQRNHKKTPCESGRPKTSAFYTPVFAKKVIDALRVQEPWSLVSCDLSCRTSDTSLLSLDLSTIDADCMVGVESLTPQERNRILGLIKHIHSVSGHGSIENLVKAMQRRGVPEHVLELAKSFRCSICEERKRVAPRRPASLETLPRKWQVVQSDMGSWYHPITKDKCKFILFIDEGCRFRTGKILFENSRSQATWPIIRQCFEEHWVAHHGQPDTIRADPEGAWRDTDADVYCQERGIMLAPIPAEAHWQIGIVENAIKGIKQVMSAIAEEFGQMTCQELFSRALWACNSRDNHLGYSPLQHAMGRSPDEWGKLHDSEVSGHPIHPQQMIDGGFAENIKAMSIAEQAFAKFQADARLERAIAAGKRPLKSFCPGDLVFYWRQQVPQNQGQRGGFSWAGQFVGPARVIAVETRVEENGQLRPGSCVWLHRGGRLIKAAPEQLRAASDRERAMEELKGPVEIPWTISSLATHPNRRTYTDISHEKPSDDQFQSAVNHPTGGIRFLGKRKGVDSEDASRVGQARANDHDSALFHEHNAQNSCPTEPTHECPSAEDHQCFEIAIDIPTSKRGFQSFLQDPQAFVVNQLRRKTVEVTERRLSPDEYKKFQEAKDKEVRNYIKSHCFRVLPSHMQPPADQAVGMRWVLTWKTVQDGTGDRKAKARAVILGYQDKSYEHKQTSSPTLSRLGRQAFLVYCAQQHFKVHKGDVSSAFLQGDELKEEMFVVPTPEICKALSIPESSITRLQRAAYGLVEAPLWWYKSVSGFLVSLGYTRLKSEPCMWAYFDTEGKVCSIISGHVDDFLFGGDWNNNIHLKLMGEIQQKFARGAWESTPFVQCGVRVIQQDNFGFTLDQEEFIGDLKPIYINRDRGRKRDLPTTDAEKSQLRALLGSLSWLCNQTDFTHSVDVGFLISSVPTSTIDDIYKANHLVHEIQRNPPKLILHGMTKGEPLDMIAWADAAWANRPDGSSSTGGLVFAAAPQSLRQGQLSDISLLSWRSYKIDRASRSPACAETHAVVDGEDELFHIRYMWSELHHPPSKLQVIDANEIVRLSPGILVSDSKNFYDKLSKDTPIIKGAERRADIEALTVKSSMDDTGLMLRWVHSDAQLANSNTKPSEKHQIILFQKLQYKWKIIYDANMVSARRRKTVGVDPMTQGNN